jgi:hypothetical protein
VSFVQKPSLEIKTSKIDLAPLCVLCKTFVSLCGKNNFFNSKPSRSVIFAKKTRFAVKTSKVDLAHCYLPTAH